MNKRDYYEILGVPQSATAVEIKKKYRSLALKLHPDRNPDNPDASEKFKEAAEAYDVLGNPEKRQIYDRFGHEGLQGQVGFSGVEDIFSNFGDIFSEFFGGDIFGGRRRSHPPRPARGADLRYDLSVTFLESLEGTKKELELTQLKRCDKCTGTGLASGTKAQVCDTCRGHGQVVQRTGFMTMSMVCPACQGKGTWIPSPCLKCEGSGQAPFNRKVTANIPPGVDTGMRLRLAGEGEHAPGDGPTGDLYIFIDVIPHEKIRRESNDLICEKKISYIHAILGDTLQIKISEKNIVDVTIPPGTQPMDEIRIKGKGVSGLGNNPTGDLVVKIKVALPKKISSDEKGLLLKLEKTQKQRKN